MPSGDCFFGRAATVASTGAQGHICDALGGRLVVAGCGDNHAEIEARNDRTSPEATGEPRRRIASTTKGAHARGERGPGLLFVAWLALTGGVAVTAVALFIDFLAHDEGGSSAAGPARAALVAALTGLVPTALFLRAAHMGRSRTAAGWLVTALAVYVVWGAFTATAVHG
jgi:hypothetical protein